MVELWVVDINTQFCWRFEVVVGGQMSKRRRQDLAHLSSYDPAYKALWQRIKRGGVSWDEWLEKNKQKAKRVCAVPECTRLFHAKQYCTKHYRRFHLYGNPLTIMKTREEPKMPEPKYKPPIELRRMSPREYFSDMPARNIRVSHSILRSLGKNR